MNYEKIAEISNNLTSRVVYELDCAKHIKWGEVSCLEQRTHQIAEVKAVIRPAIAAAIREAFATARKD